MKIKTSAAYWTVGLGLFAVLLLLLCPPQFWNQIDRYGHSGRTAISNYRPWDGYSSDRVILVADAPMTRQQPYQRPQPAQSRKPVCKRWHKVKRGQTQWFLAQAYNNRKDKQQWMKGMRWLSGKHAWDTSLKVGESICVSWTRTV